MCTIFGTQMYGKYTYSESIFAIKCESNFNFYKINFKLFCNKY